MLKTIVAKIKVLKMLLKTLRKTSTHFGRRSAAVYLFRYAIEYILRCSKRFFQIEVHITEHCNLGCWGCLHFSSLADEIFLDPVSFEQDCARLAKISSRLTVLKLLGGEPLLHPKVNVFLEIARRYFKTTVIQLTTNGILLSRQPDSFWEACQKHKVHIEVSDYPIKMDIKTIAEKCGKYRVCVEYTPPKEYGMNKKILDLDGGQDPKTSFASCVIAKYGECTTLRDGKIYTCYVAAHIKFFNKYFNKDLKITEKDYSDIYKVTDKETILDFLHKPFPFCRYCKSSAMSFDHKWTVSRKEISEWT
jgi:MoaA/NifB/PqqE/SkfB family radical SAM enzyme